MLTAYYTNAGPAREDNQDAVLVGSLISPDTENAVLLDPGQPLGVFAVADGVGGYRGGELAAKTLLDSLRELNRVPETRPGAEDSPESPSAGPAGSSPAEAASVELKITEACRRASDKMAELAAETPGYANMNTAVAGVFIGAGQITFFNSGDCRVYRLSAPHLTKMTRDHSLVQIMFDQGLIEEEEMRLHPRKNVLTSCIGRDREDFELYFKTMPQSSPQKYFICSDGVWEALPLEEIEQILCLPTPLAAATLARRLFEADASDNISFIILDQGD
ncbi:MAG: serine/threonine-protein phosphatase [Deltaproteobacteria bacterium]|jgi:serine/threonine protein phosphatase PrpC|nr:serine/threonine-protein phosphatase [Deltaproteobacteria bacterium]